MKINRLSHQAVRSSNQVQKVTSLNSEQLRSVVGGVSGISFFCVSSEGLECVIYF